MSEPVIRYRCKCGMRWEEDAPERDDPPPYEWRGLCPRCGRIGHAEPDDT